jgi:hypothetical protein
MVGYCECCCDEHGCTSVSILSWLNVPSDMCPGVVSLDHLVVLFLIFKACPYCCFP